MPEERDLTDQDAAAETLRGVIRFLRTAWHRRGVLVAVMGVSSLLGILYFTTAEPVYEAKSQLLVVNADKEALGTSLTSSGDTSAMATYEKLLASPLVLQAAAKLLDSQTLSRLGSREVDIAAAAIAKNLSVKAMRQTNILEIGFRSQHRKDAAVVVAAVIRAYATFMEESHRGTAGSIVELLEREKDEVDEKIEKKQDEYLTVRQRVGDIGESAEGKPVHPLVERAVQLNAALIETQKKRLFLEASHRALTEAVANGRSVRESLVAVEETLGKDAFLDSMGLGSKDVQTRVSIEKQLIEDRSQLDTLLQYLGTNHPRVVERRCKIQELEGYLARFDGLGSALQFGGDETAFTSRLTEIVRQRLEAATQQEEWLQQNFEKARLESIGLTSDISRLEIVENDLRWLRELRNTLLNQIASVDLRQDHGGVRTTVVREPAVPTSPVSPSLPLTVVAVAMGGALTGLGIVFVIDVLDDRARSPEELQSELALPVLATIGTLDPMDDEDEEVVGLDGAHMHNTSDDAASEGFRTIRTVIVMGSANSQRIAVSSAEPGDGKTTIATNLAVAYHQAGKRVLMIDGDMRKPGLTKLVGRRVQQGLSDLLRGTSSIDAQARSLAAPAGSLAIDVIPAGRRPPNPAELLLGDRFAELLAWAESNYDQVIVDAPPVLAGTDAAAIGRMCDGLVMVIRPDKNRRRVLARAVDMLRVFGVNILGIVVNAVGLDEQQYGYGYGYGYGDAYGLDETEEDEEEFLEEEDGVDDTDEDLVHRHDGNFRHRDDTDHDRGRNGRSSRAA